MVSLEELKLMTVKIGNCIASKSENDKNQE